MNLDAVLSRATHVTLIVIFFSVCSEASRGMSGMSSLSCTLYTERNFGGYTTEILPTTSGAINTRYIGIPKSVKCGSTAVVRLFDKENGKGAYADRVGMIPDLDIVPESVLVLPLDQVKISIGRRPGSPPSSIAAVAAPETASVIDSQSGAPVQPICLNAPPGQQFISSSESSGNNCLNHFRDRDLREGDCCITTGFGGCPTGTDEVRRQIEFLGNTETCRVRRPICSNGAINELTGHRQDFPEERSFNQCTVLSLDGTLTLSFDGETGRLVQPGECCWSYGFGGCPAGTREVAREPFPRDTPESIAGRRGSAERFFNHVGAAEACLIPATSA